MKVIKTFVLSYFVSSHVSVYFGVSTVPLLSPNWKLFQYCISFSFYVLFGHENKVHDKFASSKRNRDFLLRFLYSELFLS